MANFYAKYPSGNPSSVSIATIQGEGTAGTPVGGILTVQGDPSGTPIPITGSITANNSSVGLTGAAVPLDGTYVGYNVGGTLTGATGTSSGINIVVNAALPAGTNKIGALTTVDTVTAVTAITNALPAGTNAIGAVTGTAAAGTPATGVLSIQGITGMVAVKTDGSAVRQPVNIQQWGGNDVSTGTGTSGVGIPRVTVSSDSSLATVSTVTAVTAITNALPAGSNIIGNVRIDQTTPGTTNGVVVNTIAPVTTTTAVFQAEGAVAFGSITNLFVTLFTPSAATKMLQMRNNMNTSVAVSMDAGSTTNYVLDAGDTVSLDLLANGLNLGATAIQVKYVSAPASGSFRINGCH